MSEIAKPRIRATKPEDHYRLHVTHQTTGAESFACFPSQGQAGVWLAAQVGVTAVLSLVDGPDCFYCRNKGA